MFLIVNQSVGLTKLDWVADLRSENYFEIFNEVAFLQFFHSLVQFTCQYNAIPLSTDNQLC